MRKIYINKRPYWIENLERYGDVYVLQNIFRMEEKHFLLKGDASSLLMYHVLLQVFAYFKEKGYSFRLFLSVPRSLRDDISKNVEQLQLENEVVVLEDTPENMELSYKEIIEVADFLSGSVILKNAGKIVDGTFQELFNNLKYYFEEKHDDSE